jgi:hypothetical protein
MVVPNGLCESRKKDEGAHAPLMFKSQQRMFRGPSGPPRTGTTD